MIDQCTTQYKKYVAGSLLDTVEAVGLIVGHVREHGEKSLLVFDDPCDCACLHYAYVVGCTLSVDKDQLTLAAGFKLNDSGISGPPIVWKRPVDSLVLSVHESGVAISIEDRDGGLPLVFYGNPSYPLFAK